MNNSIFSTLSFNGAFGRENAVSSGRLCTMCGYPDNETGKRTMRHEITLERMHTEIFSDSCGYYLPSKDEKQAAVEREQYINSRMGTALRSLGRLRLSKEQQKHLLGQIALMMEVQPGILPILCRRTNEQAQDLSKKGF